MRRSFALTLAAIGAVLLATLILGSAVQAADAPGKAVFMAQKCNMCHDVSGAEIAATIKVEKMKGPDLTGFKDRQDAEWTTKFLRHEVQVDGKNHKKEWKGTDAELTELVGWLVQQ